MDYLPWFGVIGAWITAIAGLIVALSQRQKNKGDATLSITEAAKDTVDMREKDIANLKKQITDLKLYVEYLHDWIADHVKSGDEKPKNLDDFMNEKN